MKLIIVEGPDNVGKTTLINHIKDLLVNYGGVAKTHINVIHCIKPEGNNNEEKIINIDAYNEELIDNLIDAAECNAFDYVILDRSWYSEGVYGTLYRNRDFETYIGILNDYEHKLSLAYKNYNDNVWLIMLNAANSELLINNEDGNSLSNNSDDVKNTIDKEIKLFNDIFEKSEISENNKIKVIVSSYFDASKFKPFDVIMDEITEKLF